MKRVPFVISIGVCLEFYDFVIYGALAAYLSQNFFPQDNPALAIIQTFGIFAIGHIARPIGGLLAGVMGDRYGRVKPFSYSIILMAIATLGIGILPEYAQIGWWASILLLILRVIQGIAIGAEMPGAITFLNEYASSSNRGLVASFISSGSSVGLLMATLLVMVLSSSLSNAEMFSWGWRIPFLLGSLVAIVGYWLRRNLPETPYFVRYKEESMLIESSIFMALLKNHPKQLLQGLGIVFFNMCLISFGFGVVPYLNTYFGYSLPSIYQMGFIATIWSIAVVPVLGLLSDKIGRKRQLIITIVLFILLSTQLFELLNLHTKTALALFMILYQTVIISLSACYLSLLSELFPTSVRYTAVAICMNIAAALSGVMPMLANTIIYLTGQPILYVVMFLNLLAVITLVAGFSLKYKLQQELA